MQLFATMILNKIISFFKAKPALVIVITSIIIYLSLALFVNRNFIGSDGRSYQRMAVNIAEGNGYSANPEPPFERQFFREPGYPFFFSLACTLNKMAGNRNLSLTYKDSSPGYYEDPHNEILILRILQAILASLSIYLFYKTLLFFLRPSYAGLIAFLFVFYLPFSIFITFPQREILVTTILTGMGYLFLKSATARKSFCIDIAFGLLSAALVLTLQAYIFILPVFLISHVVITKNLRKTILSLAIIGFVFILGVAPWAYRGYLEAGHNLKALKTFGNSYTYEFKKFHDTNAKAYKLNLDGKGELFIQKIIAGYGEPGKVMFEKSFNGYYVNYADSLNKRISSGALTSRSDWIKFKSKEILLVNFRKAFLWPIVKPDYRKSISTNLNDVANKVMVLSLAIGFIIALLALLGILKFFGRTWFYLPVFVFHLLMIPFMADEGRRVLPFLPFFFMFFLLGAGSFSIIIKSKGGVYKK